MKGLFKVLIPLFVFGLLFTACQKEEITTSDSSNNVLSFNSGTTTGEGKEEECFSFVYPIELNFEDGTTATVTSDEELKTALTNWYDTQGENAEDPTLTFPITIILTNDASEQVLNDMDELEELEDACYGEDFYDKDCYTLKFPFSIMFTDGTTLTFNNDMEVEEAKKANPDAEFELIFPITVILEDGSELMINDEDDFEELEEQCEEEDEHDCDDLDDFEEYEDCFELVYPITFRLEDGTEVTVNNENELEQAADDYEDEEIEIVFPISFILEDGTEKTINNEEELEALLETCEKYDDDDDDDEEEEECIKLNFPLDIVYPDGQQVTVNSLEELEKLEDEADKNNVDIELVFPITITVIEDGSTVTVNNEDELEDLEDSCE